jgi:hypothetical protein
MVNNIYQTIFACLVASTLAIPVQKASIHIQARDTPTQPLPPNQEWVFSSCIPSSVNINMQCSYGGRWAGGYSATYDGCNQFTIPLWCANFKPGAPGYYPTQNGENVLPQYQSWNYVGCVGSSVNVTDTCGQSYGTDNAFIFGQTPEGLSCPTSKALWCATSPMY